MIWMNLRSLCNVWDVYWLCRNEYLSVLNSILVLGNPGKTLAEVSLK